MSVLHLPRFHFAGSWTVNPCTTNNDDVNLYNDYTNMEIYTPSEIKTDEQFRHHMMQLKRNLKNPQLDNVLINAGWNFFGDNTIKFESDTLPPTQVTMSCLPNGNIVQEDDFLIGASVSLKGHAMGDKLSPAVMVDLDPASNYSAQIFAAHFQVQAPDRNGNPIMLISNTNAEFMPMYARHMTFSRNTEIQGDRGCSVIWQFGIPKENLTLTPNIHSVTLQAFREAMNNPQVKGILVQFDCYLTTVTYSGKTLYDDFFKQGIEKENPAYGPIVGTVGLWYEGEIATEPTSGGRVLYPVVSFDTTNPDSPHQPDFPDVPVMGQAIATIDTDRKKVILNLANTIPEMGAFDQFNPFGKKYQYGDRETGLQLAVRYYDGNGYQTEELAYLPYISSSDNPYTEYCASSYAKTGGIVELSYADSRGAPYVGRGQLVLLYQNAPFLCELDYPNLMSDQFGVYVNEGDTVNITLHAEYQGQATTSSIHLEEWRCIVIPGIDEPCLSNSMSYNGFVNCQMTFLADETYPQILEFPTDIRTDSNGNITIPIHALKAGISFIRLIPPQPARDNELSHHLWQLVTLNQYDANNFYNVYPSWQYDMYLAIRVLPLDNQYNDPRSEDYISDEELIGEEGFKNHLYPKVFRYYYLMYPGMVKHIDFSNYAEMKANANIIKTFIRKGNTDNTLYMPITRELSDGKRVLTQRWCAINE
jgi:hypothetical protein